MLLHAWRPAARLHPLPDNNIQGPVVETSLRRCSLKAALRPEFMHRRVFQSLIRRDVFETAA